MIRHQWRDVLRVLFCSFYASVSSLATVFGLSFATSSAVGVSGTVMLWAVLIANVIAVPAQPFWGNLADRIGRKPIFIAGTLASAAALFAYFGVINSGQEPLIILMAVLFVRPVGIFGVRER